MDTLQFENLSSKKIFAKCAVPSMFSMLFASLYMIADGVFVGNYIGSDALAGVNIVMPLLMITFALGDMIAIGSSVRISISLGEKKYEFANKIFSTCLFMMFIISIILGTFIVFFSQDLIGLLGADKHLSVIAYDYIKIYGYFFPLIMVYFAIDNYLRVCSKQNYSMILNIVTSLLNIFLDWLFIVKMGFGIESASLASCLSISFGTILAFLPFVFKKVDLKFTKPNLPIKDIFNILYNGSSEFLSNITGSLMMLLVNSTLLRLDGALAVSAFSIVMYIDSILKPILYGMTDSIQPAISYNLGTKHIRKINELFKINAIWAFSISIFVFIIIMFNPSFFVGIFANPSEIELFELTKTALLVYIPSYLFSWFNIISSLLFTSLNKPKYSLILMLMQTVILPISSLFILTHFFGVIGVFMMGLLIQPITFVIAIILYKKIKNNVLYSDN